MFLKLFKSKEYLLLKYYIILCYDQLQLHIHCYSFKPAMVGVFILQKLANSADLGHFPSPVLQSTWLNIYHHCLKVLEELCNEEKNKVIHFQAVRDWNDDS